MAQPFRRAWDILKQGPYDHRNPPHEWGLGHRKQEPFKNYPTEMPTDWEPQERPPFDQPWPPVNRPPIFPDPPDLPRPSPFGNPYEHIEPPQERPPSDPNENPYDRIHPLPGVDPNDPYNPGPYDHIQQPQPYDSSSRISEIRTQIQRLEAELQRLLQMQGGGGHPWEI